MNLSLNLKKQQLKGPHSAQLTIYWTFPCTKTVIILFVFYFDGI